MNMAKEVWAGIENIARWTATDIVGFPSKYKIFSIVAKPKPTNIA